MISILCPTRGRPGLCKRMIQSVKATSTDVEILLAVYHHDIFLEDYKKLGCDIVLVPDWPTVQSWNVLASKATGRLLMLGADDVIFTTPNWDEDIRVCYEALEKKIHVYALQDSRDVDGTPHPIVTREYMDAMGYFIPPLFLHWFVDSWTVEIAKANNCFSHLRDIQLIHDKPSDKGDGDETHNRIRRMGWHKRDMDVNLLCQHFKIVEIQRLALAMQ